MLSHWRASYVLYVGRKGNETTDQWLTERLVQNAQFVENMNVWVEENLEWIQCQSFSRCKSYTWLNNTHAHTHTHTHTHTQKDFIGNQNF